MTAVYLDNSSVAENFVAKEFAKEPKDHISHAGSEYKIDCFERNHTPIESTILAVEIAASWVFSFFQTSDNDFQRVKSSWNQKVFLTNIVKDESIKGKD